MRWHPETKAGTYGMGYCHRSPKSDIACRKQFRDHRAGLLFRWASARVLRRQSGRRRDALDSEDAFAAMHSQRCVLHPFLCILLEHSVVAGGSLGGDVGLWMSSTGERKEHAQQAPYFETIKLVAFARYGSTLMTCSRLFVKLWSADWLTLRSTLTPRHAHEFSPDFSRRPCFLPPAVN